MARAPVRTYVREVADLIDRKRKLRSWLRLARIRRAHRGTTILSPSAGNALIAEGLSQEGPFAAGKLGSLEFTAVEFFRRRRPQRSFPKDLALDLHVAAGVFPNDDESLDRFCETYLAAIPALDVFAAWNIGGDELGLWRELAPAAVPIDLLGLDPMYHDRPWTSALAGRRVAVITSFPKTAARQYERRREIWSNPDMLPEFAPRFIKATTSPALEASPYVNWHESLAGMIEELDREPYDVLLVGAGAYSLPLVAHAKSTGHKAVHTGGSTQVLFGIRGRRFDRNEGILKFYNDSWIRPLPEETPDKAWLAENGAYW